MYLEKGSTKLPCRLEDDRIGELLVKVVSRVLHSNDTAAFDVWNHRDFLPTLAAQREQKRIHLLVVCVDLADDVFLSLFRVSQIHLDTTVSDLIKLGHRYINYQLLTCRLK